MLKKYLESGKIINTHGVVGALKLECWCDSPQILAALPSVYLLLGGQYKEYRLKSASVFKSFVIVRLDGVSNIDSAQRLVGQTVYALRDDISLGEGDHFIADLIGLDVIDSSSGRVYGKLSNVINSGASDIYVVETESGERMMPAVDEFVDRIDLERGIFISPIEGMFD